MRVGQTLPPDTNPWQRPPVCLVSHDYVKQPEVLNAVAGCSWDLVIIDEAHTLAPPTWRAEAGQRLGRTARWLLLLTATPHRGDEAAFRALCDTGRLGRDEVIVMFRRRREDVGLPRARTTRVLRVRPSTAEARLHDELTRYATRIWAEPSVGAGARLVTTVLTKRALSSASSLARSLERRRALLDRAPSPDAEQLSLPLDVDAESSVPEDDVSDIVLMAPGLSDRTLERRWLGVLATLAIRARRAERKRAALVRLVRRTAEPVVVFTEFRDTLAMLVQALRQVTSVAMVHGAQEAEERRDALARFSDGRVRVLVATDAACEGLNLHARCRLVVLYELPWNPNRLEQRIGRVDRLGQAKRVHVIELVLSGSREDTVLTRLGARLSRIAAALDPAGEPPAVDRTVQIGHDVAMRALDAAMVVGGQGDIEGARRLLASPGPTVGPAQGGEQLDFLSRLALDEQTREACVELQRLRQLGAFWGRQAPDARQRSSVIAHMQRRGPWVAVLDARRRRKHGRKVLAPAHMSGATLVTVFVTELQDASGRPVISIPTTLAGAWPPLHGVAARRGPEARALAAQLLERLVASQGLGRRVSAETHSAIAAACGADRRLLARLRQREQRIQDERERLARLHAADLFGRFSSHLSRTLYGSTDAATITPAPRYITRVSLQLALLVDGADQAARDVRER